jgi:hypothetical protein
MKETTFLDKCKGIALIFSAFGLLLFGAAALVYSASPAQADSGPQTTYSEGKYMMQMEAVVGGPKNIMNWYYVVWDTETGRSKFYYGNKAEGILLASAHYTLPSSPL